MVNSWIKLELTSCFVVILTILPIVSLFIPVYICSIMWHLNDKLFCVDHPQISAPSSPLTKWITKQGSGLIGPDSTFNYNNILSVGGYIFEMIHDYCEHLKSVGLNVALVICADCFSTIDTTLQLKSWWCQSSTWLFHRYLHTRLVLTVFLVLTSIWCYNFYLILSEGVIQKFFRFRFLIIHEAIGHGDCLL